MLARTYWGRGLATKAARTIVAYGFRHLGRCRLISLIRPDNVPSQRVAEHVGMRHERDIVFQGQPCRVYAIERTTDSATAGR
jgi:[ribosomal protein S5]-alanine N-acetyltransferase